MNDERQVMGESYEPRTQNYELKVISNELKTRYVPNH